MNFHLDDPHLDDLGEEDEELLAELLALQGEEVVTIPKSKQQAPKRLTQPQRVQPIHIPDIPEDIPMDEEMEDDDENDDGNNEDLLDELNQLMGPSAEVSPTTKRELQRTETKEIVGKQNMVEGEEGHSRNVSPKRTKTDEEKPTELEQQQRETVPADPCPAVLPPVPTNSAPAPAPPLPARPSNSNIPPPIPSRSSSFAPPPPKNNEIMPPPPPQEVPPPTVKEEKIEVSLENRAKNLLIRRRKLYMDRSMAAKQANDRAAAIEAFETVKLFNQALEAMKEGAQLSEEDLEQIPPSPPPYKTQMAQNNIPILPAQQHEPTDSITSSSVEIIKKKEGTEIKTKKEGECSGTMSEELRLVMMRQTQLKKEAIAAKQRGDLKAAKEYLTLAHQMDQMVEAARCGLPIDVQQIPELHSNMRALPRSAMGKAIRSDAETMKKCKLLERELLKQIELCEERARKFQSTGDSKHTLLYEGLLQQSKKDLQRVQLAALGQAQLPGFKLLELSLPLIELNPMVPDDKMELKILKIENLKLPEGWKPSDCALYAYYKFPFPHGTQQTGRTATSKGTNSPAFSDIFQLDINRKTKQFLRICKRQPLKVEIYQRGSFFRSDKLFAHSDLSLQELEKSATISGVFPILEGRKKTAGNVHVEIRISKPLGDGSNFSLLKRKWVKLDNDS